MTSPEQFQAGISRDSLSPRVRNYDNNLDTQVRDLFDKYHLPHYDQDVLAKAIEDRTVTLADAHHLRDLLAQRDHIRRTGEPPPEAKEARGIFTVHDALNPYRDHLLKGGIPDTDPTTAEHRDIEINLPEVLLKDITAYRASGLTHWADAIEATFREHPLLLTTEERESIEAEIKDGAIPIFMPPASVQAETTPKQYISSFNPLWIKEGQPQSLEPAFLWDHLEHLITTKDPSLTTNVPEDRPYLLLIKPTATVLPRTTNKTVTEQIAELELMNEERATNNLPPLHSIKPTEYGALQSRFTHLLADTSPQPLTILTPLDDLNHSYTRFIDLPLSSDGGVPVGYFGPVYRHLGFGRGVADWRFRKSGFRPAVRIEF